MFCIILTFGKLTKMLRHKSVKCRLCLGRDGRLTNIFSENDESEQLVREAIEELLELKVVRDTINPWLICYQCFKKLTDFYAFKQQCYENNELLERQRAKKHEEKKVCRAKSNLKVQRESNDASNNSEEDFANRGVVTGAVSELQERNSENSDHSEDIELHLSSDEEVDNKKKCDADIPQEEEGLGEEVLQAQDETLGQNSTGNLLHGCEICSKAFTTRDILKDHVMVVHLNRGMKFRCDVCSELFEYKSDLREHMTSLHTSETVNAVNKKHQCQRCSRQFQYLSRLRIHMLTHSGKRLFKCSICTKAYRQNSHLKRHMMTHSGERPHKCNICAKTFTENSTLKTHMMTHTGEKPHKCDICKKSFAQHCNLNAHMLIHTAERRSFQCATSTKAFPSNEHLKRHLLTHSD